MRLWQLMHPAQTECGAWEHMSVQYFSLMRKHLQLFLAPSPCLVHQLVGSQVSPLHFVYIISTSNQMFFSVSPASATHSSSTLTPSIIVQSTPTPPRLLSQPMKLTPIELKVYGEGVGSGLGVELWIKREEDVWEVERQQGVDISASAELIGTCWLNDTDTLPTTLPFTIDTKFCTDSYHVLDK